MIEIRPIYWIGGLVIGCCVLFFIAAYFAAPNTGGPGGKPHTKREAKAVQANIDKQHQRAEKDTLGAAALVKKGARAQVGIQAARKEVAIIHKQSISHAKPVPTTAAAIDSLQDLLSHYGDRPNKAGNVR